MSKSKQIWMAILCGIALAQESAPSISADQRAKFWRLNAEHVAAQAQEQRTKVAFENYIKELQTFCGGEGQLISGTDGEPACKEKTNAK